MTRSVRAGFALVIVLLLAWATPTSAALPSWNDGAAKQAIVAFVQRVTAPGEDFVPQARRVAVFDNDGTLWSEQPLYTEFAFSLERAAEMARRDPALAQRPAYAAALSGDPARIGALTQEQFLGLVSDTHGGVTTEDFSREAAAWIARARHPQTGRLYLDSVYQPMLELMDYLRASGFQVFIVSGGDRDFMRTFAAEVYGVAPWQVIGSSNATSFVQQDGAWTLMRGQPMTVNDGPGKPVNLALHIGLRPIFAAGNSDGDLQMLQYTTSGSGARFGLLVHHDDAAREYAYDRASSIGRLDAALDAAGPAGWTVVSIRDDWRTVFPAPGERAGVTAAATASAVHLTPSPLRRREPG